MSQSHFLLSLSFKEKKIVLCKNLKFIIKSIEANRTSVEKKVKMMTSIPSSQNNHSTWLSLPHDWGPLVSIKKRQLRLCFFKFIFNWRIFYNIVLASAMQQCELATSTHMSPRFRAFLPSRIPSYRSVLSRSTRLSSLCYTATSH